MKPFLHSPLLVLAVLVSTLPTSVHGQAPLDGDCQTVVHCPSDLHLTTSGSGTTAEFNVTATNTCLGELTVQCYLGDTTREPVRPDTIFPLGTNSVRCLVSDEAGNELTNCSFRVIVELDTQAPRLVRPPRLIVPCTGPDGARVTFTAGAIDDFDRDPQVTCDPPSGSLFPIGTNLVTCTARDSAGNRVVEQFPLIVSGGCEISRCLDIAVPDFMQVPCTSPDGAVVEFAVTARDSCTRSDLPVRCDPPSGTLFPVGLTRVTCRVETTELQGAASFLVEVTDETAPVIQCPANRTVQAASPLGAVVEFEVSATDDCTAEPSLRCAPSSGSVFPVGETRVLCQAADASGNLSQCVFVVTVLPPEPLAVTHAAPDLLELRWMGDGVVQGTARLGAEAVWQDVEDSPEVEGDEWVLLLPASERSQFFRLRLGPVVPPMDRDGDGVLDEEDRCPDTPAGLMVDETGCALFDLVATPGLALDEDEARLRRLSADLQRWPSMEAVSGLVPAPPESASPLRLRLAERDYENALAEVARQVGELDRALAELTRTRMERLEEIRREGPFLSDGYADVRSVDHELADFAEFEASLTESLWRHHEIWAGLSNIVRAVETPQPRQRVEIRSLDNRRGTALLADGTLVLLPRPGTEGAPPLENIRDAFAEGSMVDMSVATLPDGSGLAVDASSTEGVSPLPVAELNPRRLALRITPVDFGLPNFDLAPRHHLEAYRWGFTESSSRLYLEFNQALAAVPLLTLGGRPEHEHWLKIDVDLDNDGFYSSLVTKMNAASLPYVLQKGPLPEFQPFSMRVREFRRPFDQPSAGAELVSEEFYAVEVNDPGQYAELVYDRTAFELEDTFLKSGHQVARVTGIAPRFPLTLKPVGEFTFSGTSFTVAGQASSFPDVGHIGLNDPFAVHNEDPNNLLWFANTNDFPNGIFRPTVKGFNHGHAFSYRATLPMVVRDRLHACGGSQPDTYYKIPLLGSYKVSQGNNGSFTHNGWQQFAWDFPRPAFWPVAAARGGVVVDLRNSSSQSCYFPFLSNPNGTSGNCANCTGAASANFVFIRHQDGTYAWYGHFSQGTVAVSLNQRVFRGDVLGLVGTTGCSSGNHLHFHVVNPTQTTTIPARFESFILEGLFIPCYLPPANSAGASTH